MYWEKFARKSAQHNNSRAGGLKPRKKHQIMNTRIQLLKVSCRVQNHQTEHLK